MNEYVARRINRTAILDTFLCALMIVLHIYRPRSYSNFILQAAFVGIVFNAANMFSYVKFSGPKTTVFPMSGFIPLPYSFPKERIVSVGVKRWFFLWKVQMTLKSGNVIKLLSFRNREHAEKYATDIQAKWDLAQQH